MKHTNFFLVLLCCIGCSQSTEKPLPFSMQEILGQEETISWKNSIRRPIYQAKVPLNWQRIDPPQKELLINPTKSIAAFLIAENLILHVHTFPANSVDERIAPEIRIENWCAQLKINDPKISPVTHNNFMGFSCEGSQGELTLLAWSFQLEMECFQTLHFSATTLEEEEHYKQLGADLTISVCGPKNLIEAHQHEILFFTAHWNLIQEENI